MYKLACTGAVAVLHHCKNCSQLMLTYRNMCSELIFRCYFGNLQVIRIPQLKLKILLTSQITPSVSSAPVPPKVPLDILYCSELQLLSA